MVWCGGVNQTNSVKEMQAEGRRVSSYEHSRLCLSHEHEYCLHSGWQVRCFGNPALFKGRFREGGPMRPANRLNYSSPATRIDNRPRREPRCAYMKQISFCGYEGRHSLPLSVRMAQDNSWRVGVLLPRHEMRPQERPTPKVGRPASRGV